MTKEDIFIILTLPVAVMMYYIIRSNRGQKIGKKLSYKPRILNWVWAQWGGLFWLSCPICNKMFGGHEWSASLNITESKGKGVCPNCVEEANKMNKQFNIQMKKNLRHRNMVTNRLRDRL